MAPQYSQYLTNKLLKQRSEKKKPDFGLMVQIYNLLDNTNSMDIVWEFESLPYKQGFDAIGLCLRYHQAMKRRGSERVIRVYDGYQHCLKDFLEIQNDGGVIVIHNAHWLQKRARGPTVPTTNAF